MGTVINNNSKHTHVHIQGSFWWCAKHHGPTLNKSRNPVLEMKNRYNNKNELQLCTLNYIVLHSKRDMLDKI